MEFSRTLNTAIGAALLGVGLGVVLGYVEARPWAWRPPADESDAEAESDDHNGNGHEHAVVVDEPIYRFDAMEIGTVDRHGFKLTNQGDEAVPVTVANITCQCTGVLLDGKEVEVGDAVMVPPGEELVAQLEWEAKGAPRPFRHGATLSVSQPHAYRIELLVEGDLVASTMLQPQQLLLGSVPIRESKSAEVTITSRTSPSVEITSHQVEGPNLVDSLNVEFHPLNPQELDMLEVKSGVRVVATLAPQKSLGPIGGRIRLQTNLETAPELSVPVFGNITGDISILGPGWLERTGLLKLGSIRSAEGKSARLTVSIRGKHAAETELEIAKLDPEELTVTLGERRVLNATHV
ncbi:DUF1573 domain-containing protein, partial [Pirellulales bacterium]|nr:DUF1573 domain-containing protein [Pirellulales bacterium]